MLKHLHIPIFLLTFAKGIVGFGHPMIREYLIPPFPFNEDKVVERISKMKGRNTKYTTEEFVNLAKDKHGEKYDYSKVNYVNAKTPVCVICKEHGEFWQLPTSHLGGCGCPACANHPQITTETFIERANKKHNGKYDYSRVVYKNMHTKVCIICPAHGEFWQEPNSHLRSTGCPLCAVGKRWDIRGRITSEDFTKRAKEIHGDKYNYSLVNYTGNHVPVEIICPEHGVFRQMPSKHLIGQGCPHCKGSKGEERICIFLSKHNILFKKEYMLKNVDLFCTERLFVDFYLPMHNCFIEYNGEQHYKDNIYFHNNKRTLQTQQYRDMALRQYCKDHKIKLIEIPYTEYENIETILKKELKIK